MQFCFNAKKSNVKRNLPCMITHWLEWGDWLQFCHFILLYMALEMQETLRYCYFDDINRPPFYTIFNLAENWLVFKVCIIRLVHIFEKTFINFLTSTLLRAQNTTLLSKVRQIFFQILWPENPNFTKLIDKEDWVFIFLYIF